MLLIVSAGGLLSFHLSPVLQGLESYADRYLLPPAAELFRMTGWRFKQSSATPKLLAEPPGFLHAHWPALPTGP